MMGDVMEFPETFEEFAKAYSIVDREEVYTNGAKLIPVFRVKQWLENTALRQKMVDRDALLELAEDVDEAAAVAVVMDSSEGTKLLADMLLDVARRIREALGVES